MQLNDTDIVIVSAKRTPIGMMLGELSSLTAPELGAVAHSAAIIEAGIAPGEIDEVISGCVLQAGIGQAPARQAAIAAGIPVAAGATTVNKMCGSGMKAVMLGFDSLKAGSADIVLASGMESMSNAPYLLKKARAGYRLGHGELKDHMYLDGLEDAYDGGGQLMGCFAETTASHYDFTRHMQDEFAIRSMSRALLAQETGAFFEEIAPVTVKSSKQETLISTDQGPDQQKIAKVPNLKPIFRDLGTVTAANSSGISDGAASLILMSASLAKKRKLKPLAKIAAHASHAQAPAWFTTAPIEAIRKVIRKAGWHSKEVALYEINEAFAVVVLAAMLELELEESMVNIHGGACALGHPIGATGARIIVTLIHALKRQNKRRGVAALCIGGGEATALAIEVL